jgi:hypothetical protein
MWKKINIESAHLEANFDEPIVDLCSLMWKKINIESAHSDTRIKSSVTNSDTMLDTRNMQ